MRQMIRVVAWMLLFRLGAAFVRADGTALQTPPARQPTNVPQLSGLLVDAQGKLISAQRSWLKQRARLKERWERFLGEVPTIRESLKTGVLATERTRVSSRAQRCPGAGSLPASRVWAIPPNPAWHPKPSSLRPPLPPTPHQTLPRDAPETPGSLTVVPLIRIRGTTGSLR
jgi:hypothetical protein